MHICCIVYMYMHYTHGGVVLSPDLTSKEEKGLVNLGKILGHVPRNFHVPVRSWLWLSHMTSLPQECNIVV